MFYKSFRVTGLANTTVLDAGLVSLVGEKYHINAILIATNENLNNTIEGWIGTNRVLEIPDYVLDTIDDGAATINYRATSKLNRIPIDMDIPEGQIFKIGVAANATPIVIYGSYEYVKVS